MASVLVLLSKSFFETKLQVDGAVAGIGDVVPVDRYLSTNKRLEALVRGDALFLVTVRPPDEELWLVAILDDPLFEATLWRSNTVNRVPIVNIDNLRDQLTFDNGKGITAAPGRLGMSLQTPRLLTSGDVALLRGAAGLGAGTKQAPGSTTAHASADAVLTADRDHWLKELSHTPDDVAIRERAVRACVKAGEPARGIELLRGRFIHFNAHDVGPLPCMCKRCLQPEVAEASTQGVDFVREFAIAEGRVLFFWVPKDLAGERRRVAASVASNLRHRFRGGGA